MINQEREDLNGLLTHPGWLRLKAHLDDLYGPEQMVRHYESAANVVDQAERLAQIAQITQRLRAVRDILDWPAKRIKDLERPIGLEPTYSRQGY